MNGSWLDTLVTPWRRARVTHGPGSRTRPDLHFMHLPGASIRYRMAGSGERCLVFCADPPVTLELYDALITALAPDFRVVVFELPAFGLSLPRLGLDFGLEAMAGLIGDFFCGNWHSGLMCWPFPACRRIRRCGWRVIILSW
ncbi:MAG: alpha/beta hydrolase family protein [Nevskia sp.]|nr:alpha/beta hydrolase family protein [Nevskia sp.]